MLFVRKPVTDPTNRIQIDRSAAQFIAQSPHMRIHGARVDVPFVLPNIAQQSFPGLHQPATLHQHQEKLEFRCRKIEWPAAENDGMTWHIDQQEVASPEWPLQPGWHTVTATDEQGRKESVQIVVK